MKNSETCKTFLDLVQISWRSHPKYNQDDSSLNMFVKNMKIFINGTKKISKNEKNILYFLSSSQFLFFLDFFYKILLLIQISY